MLDVNLYLPRKGKPKAQVPFGLPYGYRERKVRGLLAEDVFSDLQSENLLEEVVCITSACCDLLAPCTLPLLPASPPLPNSSCRVFHLCKWHHCSSSSLSQKSVILLTPTANLFALPLYPHSLWFRLTSRLTDAKARSHSWFSHIHFYTLKKIFCGTE